jgi:hypothetical protein
MELSPKSKKNIVSFLYINGNQINIIKYNNMKKYLAISLCFLVFLCINSKDPLNNDELSKEELDKIIEELKSNPNIQSNL